MGDRAQDMGMDMDMGMVAQSGPSLLLFVLTTTGTSRLGSDTKLGGTLMGGDRDVKHKPRD
jgi:hypothetical protein